MWIAINILIYYFKDVNIIAIFGILIWGVLSIIFYYIAKKFIPKY